MVHRFSRYFGIRSSGALAYIVSKNKKLPEFITNENIKSSCNQTTPRESYSIIKGAFCFDTYENDLPFIIVDVGPKYSIIPHVISTFLYKGYTSAISYELSVSNDKDNWEVIASPPLNNSYCSEDSSVPERCGETVALYDDCKITRTPHRYVRYKVLENRGGNKVFMRLARIEVFGDLFGSPLQCTNKMIKSSNFVIANSILIILISHV